MAAGWQPFFDGLSEFLRSAERQFGLANHQYTEHVFLKAANVFQRDNYREARSRSRMEASEDLTVEVLFQVDQLIKKAHDVRLGSRRTSS